MIVKSHTDTNNMDEDLGQWLKENLELQWFRKVRVFSNPDDECLSVEGRIGERGKVTIRVDGKDDRREIILVDVYHRSKLIWSRIDNSNFTDIISFAKLLIYSPLDRKPFRETAPELVVKVAGKHIPASTPESVSPTELVSPELATLAELNEPQEPKPTQSTQLGSKVTVALSLLAMITIGMLLYLVWEVKSSHQQIQ